MSNDKHFNFKHGKAGTRVYRIYNCMRQRCLNENHDNYRYYGGAGIKICDRWLESFVNFYEDMGDPPDGHEIDRIDNAKGYEPDNCRWVTRSENLSNRDVYKMDINKRDILGSAKRALEKHRGNWPKIAYKADVSYSWLAKVAEGKTQNPRITELQKLITTLDKIDRGRIKLN